MTKQKIITGVLGGLAAIVAVYAGALYFRNDEKIEDVQSPQTQDMPQYIQVPLSDKIFDDLKNGKSVHVSSYMFKTMIVEKNKDGTTTYTEVPQFSFK